MTSALAVSLKRAIEFSIAVEKMKARVFDDWQKQAETSKVTFAQVILDVQKAIYSALSSFNGGVEMSSEKLKEMHEVKRL